MTSITITAYSAPVYLAYIKHRAAKAAAAHAPKPRPVTAAQAAHRERMRTAAALARGMYRDYVQKDPAARGAATWAAAMREAWSLVNADRDRRAFFAAPGAVQLDTLRRIASRLPAYAAKSTRRRPAGYTDPAPEKAPTNGALWADWMTPTKDGGRAMVPWGEALDTIAAEAWSTLAELDAAPENKPWTVTMADHVIRACKRLRRAYIDGPKGTAGAASLEDPEYAAAAHFPGPEAGTIHKLEITAYALDPVDEVIAQGTAYGLDQWEISAEVERRTGHRIKRAAVARRLGRMRDRRAAEEYAPENYAAPEATKPRPRNWTPDGASTAPGYSAEQVPPRRSIPAPEALER